MIMYPSFYTTSDDCELEYCYGQTEPCIQAQGQAA